MRKRDLTRKTPVGSRSEDHYLYTTWLNMRNRCNNKNNKNYNTYGKKGIIVDPAWDDFSKFIEDIGARPSPEHSIDRIDNARGYYKENCRWATKIEQANNRRITFECHRGHPWTEENTEYILFGKKKYRKCIICNNLRTEFYKKHPKQKMRWEDQNENA